jgi:hypothetical protein
VISISVQPGLSSVVMCIPNGTPSLRCIHSGTRF